MVPLLHPATPLTIASVSPTWPDTGRLIASADFSAPAHAPPGPSGRYDHPTPDPTCRATSIRAARHRPPSRIKPSRHPSGTPVASILYPTPHRLPEQRAPRFIDPPTRMCPRHNDCSPHCSSGRLTSHRRAVPGPCAPSHPTPSDGPSLRSPGVRSPPRRAPATPCAPSLGSRLPMARHIAPPRTDDPRSRRPRRPPRRPRT